MTTCAEAVFQQPGGVSRVLLLLSGLLDVPTLRFRNGNIHFMLL